MIEFRVFDEEFVAGPECIVKIPKLANFSITALSNAVVYDVGGLPRWQAYMLDRASILQYDPERAKNPVTFAELRIKFDVQISIY